MEKELGGVPPFGVALDPFRPQDITAPPGVATRPPICPSAICLQNQEEIVYFLYINNKNNAGDVLLSCLNCGYETVYRVATSKYEPRPGRDATGWLEPLLDMKQAKKIAKGKAELPKPPEPKPAKTAKPVLIYSVADAAKVSGKSLDTLYEAVRLKRLVATKKDKKVIIKSTDLEKYLKKYPPRG